MTKRERERKKEGKRERERERKIDRQKERKKDIKTVPNEGVALDSTHSLTTCKKTQNLASFKVHREKEGRRDKHGYQKYEHFEYTTF